MSDGRRLIGIRRRATKSFRNCLKCDGPFMSLRPHNRLCPRRQEPNADLADGESRYVENMGQSARKPTS